MHTWKTYEIRITEPSLTDKAYKDYTTNQLVLTNPTHIMRGNISAYSNSHSHNPELEANHTTYA